MSSDALVQDMVIALSGGFDIIHPGHIRMIQGAACFGKVVIILNSDEWLRRKRGFVMMHWDERREILSALEHVADVVPVDDSDGTVCEALRRIRPDIFGNGGLRLPSNTPERRVCQELDIKLVFGLGGAGRDTYTNEVFERVVQAGKSLKI